jgi:5-methyltetrahydrofolate--homocysteine methyltransferase
VFAVTAGLGVEKKEKYFLDDLDDYSAIMLKAMADRLAEAFAECAAPARAQGPVGLRAARGAEQRELIGEKYRGIRPRRATRPARTTA